MFERLKFLAICMQFQSLFVADLKWCIKCRCKQYRWSSLLEACYPWRWPYCLTAGNLSRWLLGDQRYCLHPHLIHHFRSVTNRLGNCIQIASSLKIHLGFLNNHKSIFLYIAARPPIILTTCFKQCIFTIWKSLVHLCTDEGDLVLQAY